MKTVQISAPEFAMLKGISRQAVVQNLQRGNLYPEILRFKKIGSVYVLTVLKSWHDGVIG